MFYRTKEQSVFPVNRHRFYGSFASITIQYAFSMLRIFNEEVPMVQQVINCLRYSFLRRVETPLLFQIGFKLLQ